MQIGVRMPQTGRNLAIKENIVYLAKQAENAEFFTISKITEANIRKCS
jgi:hypothetical protein